jgi:hypothetical protein
VLLSNLTICTLLLSLPLFLVEWNNWGDEHIGLLLAGLSLPMVFLSPVDGRLSDYGGAHRVFPLPLSSTAPRSCGVGEVSPVRRFRPKTVPPHDVPTLLPRHHEGAEASSEKET